MTYFRRSRFVFGTGDWTTEVSAQPWIPADNTVGGSRTSAAGIAASYIVRRDILTELTLRVSEDEWDELLALVAYGQASLSFTWYPDADEAASYAVYLEAPLAGERWSPARTVGFLRQFEVTVTLRNTAGVDPWQPYFADEPPGPADQVVATVTVTPNAVPDLPVGTGQLLIGQALNVSVQGVPNAVATWVSADPAVATVSPGTNEGDGQYHANVSAVATGSTTVTPYINGVPSTPVPIVVSAAPAGAAYWTDTQAGGVFAASSGGYGWWTLSGGAYNPPPSVVADAGSPTGYAVRFRFNPTTANSLTEARLLFGAHLTEVYIGWSEKLPLNYYHRSIPTPNNNKMLRAWGNAYSENEGNGDRGLHLGFSTRPRPDGGSNFDFHNESKGITAGDGSLYLPGASVPGISLATDLNRYIRFVWHSKRATAPNAKDGIIEFWKDGVLIYARYNLDMWDYSPVPYNYVDKMYLLGAANSGFSVVTDILIQRVTIGPTYASVA